ncbi:MAG: hypothetical protein IPO08_23415, partial [Xanthomonadales bacterium]|nr:hypothetical protein [Xanthomonadales bacterium]
MAESVQKSADNTPRNIKEARQWILDAVDAAIAKAPTEAAWKKLKNNDASTITFDVPGDGKFKVLNHKERLKAFRAQVSASVGFKAPAKNLPTIQRDSNPGNYSVRDFLKDGDYLTAYQFAQWRG